ncbi:MAG: DNA-binding protein WhiA [Firmicutes bacterium]|nr:DNA-binding protein WhiA [Bacillota bacterium]
MKSAPPERRDMSFASETKNELARLDVEKKCCMLSEIAAYIRTAGDIELDADNNYMIELQTDEAAIARHFKILIKEYFAVDCDLVVYEGGGVGRNRKAAGYSYHLILGRKERAEQILRECGIIRIKGGRDYLYDGIYDELVKAKCDRKAYLRGAFLGTGTMSDPVKAYHLEFDIRTEGVANDLRKVINSFTDMQAKIVKRGSRHVVYMKKADYVSDMLAIMGASGSMLKLEDIRIKKGLVSTAKREINCDSANLDRAVDTAMRQVEAIRRIAEVRGLKSLEPKLRETALLRLEHPDATIQALGEMCDPPLKKSGINSRLRKIEEIASKI